MYALLYLVTVGSVAGVYRLGYEHGQIAALSEAARHNEIGGAR